MDKKLDFLTKDLVDKAAIEIDKNGIPTHRKGTGYAVFIGNKDYPYKLLVTEAAKYVNVTLTSNDFNSNANNRLGFEKLTGYKISSLDDKIEFKNLEQLVKVINLELGDFCSKFQYTRKKLLKMGSATNRDKLFIFSDKNRDWVINPGGGTELQYHLFLRNSKVSYGIGFNTQYVPFANKKTPVEYIQPYVDSFLSNSKFLENLLQNDFNFIIGDESNLTKLEHDNYVLIGKEIDVIKKGENFEMSNLLFKEMIGDLKEILFETYKKVLSNMNSQNRVNEEISEKIKIVLAKKQIILQGPPGTGKTYTAKDIAEHMIFSDVSLDKKLQKQNLEKSDQFKLVQFHPSYSYEDFVRGITAKSEEGNIVYETENKILGKFADKAKSSEKPFVLIIDEINRANLPSVLGELIYALEYRGESVESMYGIADNFGISIPENLYIIGTMNTADRSVGHIDYAIKRRFAFVDILPDLNVIKNEKAKELFVQVEKLFCEDLLASDFDKKDVQLGHSYFILKEGTEEEQQNELQMRLKYEIIPILREYVKDGLLLEEAKTGINKIAEFV